MPERIVLWASRGLRMASIIPEFGPPRHASATTIHAAADQLARLLPHDLEPLHGVEERMAEILKEADYASLVRTRRGSWTGHAARGAATMQQEAATPQEALHGLPERLRAPAALALRITSEVPRRATQSRIQPTEGFP